MQVTYLVSVGNPREKWGRERSLIKPATTVGAWSLIPGANAGKQRKTQASEPSHPTTWEQGYLHTASHLLLLEGCRGWEGLVIARHFQPAKVRAKFGEKPHFLYAEAFQTDMSSDVLPVRPDSLTELLPKISFSSCSSCV